MTNGWWAASDPARFERVRLGLRSACGAAWRVSRRLEGEVPDADAWVSSGSAHLGDPAAAIDAEMQDAIETSLHHHLPEARVVGEEVSRTLLVRDEGLLILVDACDGTLLRETLGVGWGTSLVALVWIADSGWQPVAAAASTATGRVVTYTPPRLIQIGRLGFPPGEDQLVGDVRRPEGDARVVVAMVGAKATMLGRFSAYALSLAAEGAFAVFNIGGAPFAFAIAQLDLDAVVTLNGSPPWDCSHTLIAAAGGASVATLGANGNARSAGFREVESWFRLDADPNAIKTVPPHVVARSQRALDIVIQAHEAAVSNTRPAADDAPAPVAAPSHVRERWIRRVWQAVRHPFKRFGRGQDLPD